MPQLAPVRASSLPAPAGSTPDPLFPVLAPSPDAEGGSTNVQSLVEEEKEDLVVPPALRWQAPFP